MAEALRTSTGSPRGLSRRSALSRRLEACPLHGLRKHIVCEGAECLCNEDLAVLVMPECGLPQRNPLLDDRIIALWDELNAIGVFWGDPRPAITLIYEGRLVAADFGLPD